MGASEIEAVSRFGPFWGPLIVVIAILIPAVIPMLRREKEKPVDPTPGIITALRALERTVEEVQDDNKDLRRDFDKLERRVDLYQAIRDMGKRHE